MHGPQIERRRARPALRPFKLTDIELRRLARNEATEFLHLCERGVLTPAEALENLGVEAETRRQLEEFAERSADSAAAAMVVGALALRDRAVREFERLRK